MMEADLITHVSANHNVVQYYAVCQHVLACRADWRYFSALLYAN